MEGEVVARELLDFVNASWSPFHAVDECKKRLVKAGFQALVEEDEWTLLPGGKYFFTRNYSTIVAFAIGKKFLAGNGFNIIGAHTDSPCPKLKPVSRVSKSGFLSVGVQTYGGGLWHTWFDRDLSVAGRVLLQKGKADVSRAKAEGEGRRAAAETSSPFASYEHRLVRVDRPIMRIPTLAIHLDREINTSGFKPNTQSHLLPILATAIKDEVNRKSQKAPDVPASDAATSGAPPADASEKSNQQNHHPALLEVLATELGCDPEDIRDFELSVCDTQAGVLGGAFNEFVFVGRLDNLCMSFCSLKALISSVEGDEALEEEEGVRVVALFDHEECGSGSAVGAESPIISSIFRRITASSPPSPSPSSPLEVLVERAVRKSFVVSADMAHCLHPNYPEKHEESHQPKMHKGLVIKHNANQRYATNSVTAFLFREIGRVNNLPVQDFVVRNDTGCGSTIGPILASGLGIRTVDVGAPQLSMHSIREVCGVDDVGYAYQHFKAFFEQFGALDKELAVDKH